MNRLSDLIASARERAVSVERMADTRQLEKIAQRHSPRGFRNKLWYIAQSGPAMIAELKKASPSQGLIRDDFAVEHLARRLRHVGAAALSVLTEERFFQGSLQHLEVASAVSGLPCLRKDFIVTEFQIIEARAHGADAVLLILAALSDSQFRGLLEMAHALELDALCEVHDERDLDRALAENADMVGVNSRDLSDFSIYPRTFELIAKIPETVIAVAESGICNGSDIRFLRDQGYHAFLLGQTLMEAEDPGVKLTQLLTEAKTHLPVLQEK